MIAENSIIEKNVEIGEGTNIWYFSHLMEGVKIGRNCNIGDNVFVGKNVIIGDNVRVANGVNIYEGTIIKNDVFIGNNVSFENVKYPRAFRKANQFLSTIVEEGASILAHACITAGIRIGKKATVGTGAIVINDVSDNSFVINAVLLESKYNIKIIKNSALCICNRDECEECRKLKQKQAEKKKYDR